MPAAGNDSLLVGYDKSDDAGVFALDEERALVVTADFITPVIDDPRTFGAVAAANSISDVYAMGGRPLTALNICGFPEKQLPAGVISEIFAGAADKCREAGVAVAGGHTVRDDEVKFGLSVTGLVHPDRILRNDGARPGDALILTKPLGTGALAAALKSGALAEDSDDYRALIETMSSLNRCGTVLADLGVKAATDITGFGLTGHAAEMATAAGVGFEIDTAALPLLPDAVARCGAGFTCGGTVSNAEFTAGRTVYGDGVDEAMRGLLNDPQTSGGLLFAVPADRVDEAAAAVLASGALCAPVIGRVKALEPGRPHLFFS